MDLRARRLHYNTVQLHHVQALVDQYGCPGQQTHRLMLEVLSHLIQKVT
ncbi:MAG: hypothetical protein ACE5JQ_02580 [Candidatus Methylomirabilales bacterium]